jgi:hypothetical protein
MDTEYDETPSQIGSPVEPEPFDVRQAGEDLLDDVSDLGWA